MPNLQGGAAATLGAARIIGELAPPGVEVSQVPRMCFSLLCHVLITVGHD